MKILSLDISSTTIGWASMKKIKKKISLINYGHIKPMTKAKSKDNLCLRLDSTIKEFNALLKKEKPDLIIIEEYAKRFQKGKSSANTIILLAVFNESIALESYRFTGEKPIKYTVGQIRSSIEKQYSEKVKEKEDVIRFIVNLFPSFKTVLNRVGNIKKECGDEADAIILGLHHLLIV